MVKKTLDAFNARLAALRDEEKGMEAAQVILILVIVVIGLIPIFNKIYSAISKQGSTAVSGLSSPSSVK